MLNSFSQEIDMILNSQESKSTQVDMLIDLYNTRCSQEESETLFAALAFACVVSETRQSYTSKRVVGLSST